MCNQFCRENKAIVITDCYTMIDPALRVIPLDFPHCTVPASIILRKGQVQNPEITLFIDFMVQWCKKNKRNSA